MVVQLWAAQRLVMVGAGIQARLVAPPLRVHLDVRRVPREQVVLQVERGGEAGPVPAVLEEHEALALLRPRKVVTLPHHDGLWRHRRVGELRHVAGDDDVGVHEEQDLRVGEGLEVRHVEAQDVEAGRVHRVVVPLPLQDRVAGAPAGIVDGLPVLGRHPRRIQVRDLRLRIGHRNHGKVLVGAQGEGVLQLFLQARDVLANNKQLERAVGVQQDAAKRHLHGQHAVREQQDRDGGRRLGRPPSPLVQSRLHVRRRLRLLHLNARGTCVGSRHRLGRGRRFGRRKRHGKWNGRSIRPPPVLRVPFICGPLLIVPLRFPILPLRSGGRGLIRLELRYCSQWRRGLRHL